MSEINPRMARIRDQVAILVNTLDDELKKARDTFVAQAPSDPTYERDSIVAEIVAIQALCRSAEEAATHVTGLLDACEAIHRAVAASQRVKASLEGLS